MFPAISTPPAASAASAGNGDPGADLQWLLDAVTNLQSNACDAVLIDRIAALERLKSGCAAAQARLTATFADSQAACAAARQHRPDATRRSIAGQVALARRDSPFAGRRHVGVAAALVGDMPHTLAALTRGELSERRAAIVVGQLACLTPKHRREADRLLAPDLPAMGDRSAESRAAAMAYRLDPEAVMAKVRGAVTDRHVSLRPAPETMSRLSALLPVGLGVAVYAALSRYASAATAVPGGDPRSRGQLMADALVSAVTGQVVTGCDAYGAPQYAATPTAATPMATPTTATATATPTAATGTPTAATGAPAAPSTAAAPGAAPTDRVEDDEDAEGEITVAISTVDTDTATDTVATDTDVAAAAPDSADTPDMRAAAGPAGAARTAAAPAATAPAPAGRCSGGCGISINLIMTDRTLLDGDDEPAHLHGHGPIPAPLARALVIGAADTGTRTFIRRLYTDPTSKQLITMDPKRRLFPPAAQRFLLARDHTCRTPWCDAPIRQADHIQSYAAGGPTTIDDGQGVCQTCNLTKAAPHWSATAADGTITTTVPTGHTYSSRPPTPPRSAPWADISTIEHRVVELLLAA